MEAQFKQSSPIIFCIVFALICCLIGVVFFFIKPWIGILAIVLGISIPVLVGYLGTSYVIRCSDSGFSVDQSSRRKGSSHAEYGWPAVTRTEYEEFDRSGINNDRSGTSVCYFSAYCGEERAFKIGRIRGFKNLIKLFNQMTPHLPYTWEPRTGLSIQVGNVSVGKRAYVQVPRSQPPTNTA